MSEIIEFMIENNCHLFHACETNLIDYKNNEHDKYTQSPYQLIYTHQQNKNSFIINKLITLVWTKVVMVIIVIPGRITFFLKRIQLHVMALYIYNNSVNHHFIVMGDFNYNPITHTISNEPSMSNNNQPLHTKYDTQIHIIFTQTTQNDRYSPKIQSFNIFHMVQHPKSHIIYQHDILLHDILYVSQNLYNLTLFANTSTPNYSPDHKLYRHKN